jgi:formylglycine-generating enzyme required for sulfatase activity/predicted Ser/Thr protein kinase
VPQVGDRLGDFTIEREIGRGNMGVVYEARQASLGRRVAVKVLTPAALGNAEWLERFQGEARAAAQLSHPGILPIYAVGEEQGVPWFAMEFVEGRDLSSIVAEGGALAPREAARVVRDAALALDHAHLHTVIHRDVKPGNLMLREDGRVVLTDFGLAKHLGSGSLTGTGSLVGTPFYMSPEQAIGEKGTVGPKADVYGLGASLYELLTGRPPFEAENAVALLRIIADRDPVPPRRIRPEIPRDLETIVLSCMEKSPARRYASCHMLAEDLDRFLRDEAISRRRPGPIERTRRLVARNRVASAALAGAVLLLVAGWWVAAAALDSDAERVVRRVEDRIELARAAIAAGDPERAQEALAPVAGEERAAPAQRAAIVAILSAAVEDRLRRATERDDPDAAEAVTEGIERLPLPEAEKDRVLPRARLVVRADEGARVLLARFSQPRGEGAVLRPGAEHALRWGVYRLEVEAPGRVPLTTALALAVRGEPVEVTVRLPSTGDVPAGMVALGGQIVRLPARDGGVWEHDVSPFLLDRTEVTVEEYAAYLAGLSPAEREARTPAGWGGGRPPPGSPRLPVAGVTWEMAEAFAAHAGNRLPTRAELQHATLGLYVPRRNPRSRFDPARFEGEAVSGDSGARGPLPVDRAKAHAAASGVQDLLGNVAEWSASTQAGDPWRLLVVGGSFEQSLGPSALARLPHEASPAIGFRCARSLPAPRPLAAAAADPHARRLRIDADGALVGLREVEVGAGDRPAPDGIVETPGIDVDASVGYRVVGATAPNRKVEVVGETVTEEGARRTRRARLRIGLAPRERVRVTLEEAFSPWPAGDSYVRQGSRVDLDVAADDGIEVTLPRDAVVSRTDLSRARQGHVRGRVVVRVPPLPGERLRLEAVVPSLERSFDDETAAAAAAETTLRAVADMDGAAFRVAVAPEYHSAFLDDPAKGEASLAELKALYRTEAAWARWSADREGDRMVVRRIVTRWDFHPLAGGAPQTPVAVPRAHASYCRRRDGRWEVVTETMAALAPLAGHLERDGAWTVEELGIVVRAPFGGRVRPGEGGTGDVEVSVALDEPHLQAEVMGYLRVDPGIGIPPLTAAHLRRYGFEVLDGGTESARDGTTVVDFVHAQERNGTHYCAARRTWRRGDVVVVALIQAAGTTPEQAKARLAEHRPLVDRFLDAVSLGP